MKKVIFLFFLWLPFMAFSQGKFSKEIGLNTDNDLYVSINRDRYYTNGLFLSYRHLKTNNNESLDKKIFEWQVGHEMYTPYKAVVTNIKDHDRPFAGHLFGRFGVKNVYKNNTILNFSLQLGIVGPSAFGEELQDFMHNIYGFEKAVGWKHQIKNTIGLNLSSSYIHFISTNKDKTFDLIWESTARAGTIYTDLSSGLNMRIGFFPLQKLMNSIAYQTNLNDTNTRFVREAESFFYIKPMLRYAFYDATLQGSLFNDESEVTRDLVPLVFDIEVGIKFTANRYNFGYTFHYNTSKSEDLRYTYGNKYGTITVNYLLH